MTGDELPIPAAVCTVCGAYVRDAKFINQRCGNKPSGKQCKGAYGGAQQEKDWEECPSCSATDRTQGGKCSQCAGFGWIFARGR